MPVRIAAIIQPITRLPANLIQIIRRKEGGVEKTGEGSRLIDEYIAAYPENVQVLLKALRETIRAAAPAATEKISYQMPAFALDGNLVYFGGWKNHVGFYPGGSVEPFKDDLAGYVVDKGTIRFALDRPLPVALITRIVKFRVDQNRERAAAKAARKVKSVSVRKVKSKEE
jgi:uncharacterized protein YdhG (YjbR/CyaY superfamily)